MHHFCGKREWHADFQKTGLWGDFPGILVGNAGGDNAQLGLTWLDTIEFVTVAEFSETRYSVQQVTMSPAGVSGNHYILGGILCWLVAWLGSANFARFDHSLAMADAGSSA